MTDTPKLRCDDCDHIVEKIIHTSDGKPVIGTESAITAEYKHRQPHRNCPCPRFNMTSAQVR